MRSHSTCTLHASNTETRLVLQVRTRFAESKVPEPLPAAVSASWGIVEGSFRGKGSPEDHIQAVMIYTLILSWRCRRRLRPISARS